MWNNSDDGRQSDVDYWKSAPCIYAASTLQWNTYVYSP